MVNKYRADDIHGDLFYTLPDGAEFILASDYDALEARIAGLERELLASAKETQRIFNGLLESQAMLAAEVAENVRLRSREVGDEVGNLEQEVADLNNELSCVKAESLRVVKDGEAIAAGDARGNHTFIMRGGEVFISEPHCWNWSRIDGTFTELNEDIFVQPVRLERWEDEG